MPDVPTRLLVVDDDPSLLQLIEKYLTRLGYQVETCSQGGDAWSLFAREPDRFALVLADLTLKDMSGEELLLSILSLRPAMPVLVCSGYPFEVGKLGTKSSSRVGFIQKPFLPKMLADALDDLLRKSVIT